MTSYIDVDGKYDRTGNCWVPYSLWSSFTQVMGLLFAGSTNFGSRFLQSDIFKQLNSQNVTV